MWTPRDPQTDSPHPQASAPAVEGSSSSPASPSSGSGSTGPESSSGKSTASPVDVAGRTEASAAYTIGVTGQSKVWSPSQTDDYSRCPRLWDLSRRWERFAGGQWTPERVVGDALHAYAASFLRGRDVHGATEAAHKQLRADWPADAPPEHEIEGSIKTITRVAVHLTKYIDSLFAQGYEFKIAEWAYGGGKYPECIVDAIFVRPDRKLHIVDWKYHGFLKPEHIHYRVDETELMHAMWHYAWRVGESFGGEVGSFGKVMLIGAPSTKVRDCDVEVTPEALDKWQEGSWAKWWVMDRMRAGALPIYPNYHACKLFGGCAFYDGCHRCAGDETKFDALYKRKVWTEWRTR